jgi:hypothetical protein
LTPNKIGPFTVVIIVACVIGVGAQREHPSRQMKADVDRLIAHAKNLRRLWPWEPPIPDVARVSRYGKRVAPLLLDLLDEDPDAMDDKGHGWAVQQQAALTLCRIYRVAEQCGHIYCNRATREENKAVKRFWVSKASE